MIIKSSYEDLNLLQNMYYHEIDGTEVQYSGLLIKDDNKVTVFFPTQADKDEVDVEIGEIIEYDESLLINCNPENPQYAMIDLDLESMLCLYHTGLLTIDKAGVVSLRFGTTQAYNDYRLGGIVDFDLCSTAKMIAEYYLESISMEQAS